MEKCPATCADARGEDCPIYISRTTEGPKEDDDDDKKWRKRFGKKKAAKKKAKKKLQKKRDMEHLHKSDLEYERMHLKNKAKQMTATHPKTPKRKRGDRDGENMRKD